ncbi:MAG: competence type IV pilus assembly protein ComGB [Caryophanon sp.]|nr:competence type IV pilus assembly protein ComGB [Caryophanon sp.]
MNIQRQQPLLKKHDVFLTKLAQLLQEGYTVVEALKIVLPHYATNKEKAEQLVDEQLAQGTPIHVLLQKLGIAPNHLLIMELASYHSSFEEVLQTTAQQIARRIELERQTKRKMMYPVVLFIGLFSSLIVFRQYFLPNMMTLFSSRNEEQSLLTSSLFLRLPDIFLVLLIGSIVAIVVVRRWLKQQSGAQQVAFLYRLPLIRQYMQLYVTRELAYILSGFLKSGVSLQQALSCSEQQDKSRIISHIAEQLKELVLSGMPLSEAVTAHAYFRRDFTSYIHHGEANGQLAGELHIYAKILEQYEQERQTIALSCVQPVVFSVVAVCIVGAYLAILLPMYDMITIM